MSRYPFIFFILNLIDGAITNYLMASEYAVEEANPTILYIVENYGWLGFWIYKISAFFAIMGLVCAFFRKEKRDRIIKWACIVFSFFVAYMCLLLLFQIF